MRLARAVGKASEYRSCAEAAVSLAAGSNDADCKALMLKVAQGWLDLAQRIEQRTAGLERWMSSSEIVSPAPQAQTTDQ
jgi:hypothetical protein